MFTKNSNDLSPIEDYNKLSKMIFKTANLAFKIAKDKVITNKEAIKYNKMARQITEFESELKQKYENDEESLKLIEEYKVCNSEEIEKMNSYNMMSFMALYECEGVDKLY
jgi:preprotein translocase subunit SecD